MEAGILFLKRRPAWILNHLKYAQIVTVDDIEYANDLLSRYHYLGAKKLEGEHMRYRVTYRGAWVAVLYCEQPARAKMRRDRRFKLFD